MKRLLAVLLAVLPLSVFGASPSFQQATNLVRNVLSNGTVQSVKSTNFIASGIFYGTGSGLTNLTGSSITGAVSTTSFTASGSPGFVGDGSGMTNLNADNLASGTLADARLSANVPVATNDYVFAGNFDFQIYSLYVDGIFKMTSETDNDQAVYSASSQGMIIGEAQYCGTGGGELAVDSGAGSLVMANLDTSTNILVSAQDESLVNVCLSSKSNVTLAFQNSFSFGTPPSNYTNSYTSEGVIFGPLTLWGTLKLFDSTPITWSAVTVSNAPAVSSDSASIYAATNTDGTVEIITQDGLGNQTVISPHRLPPSELLDGDDPIPAVFHDVNEFTGRERFINTIRHARRTEQLLNAVQVLASLVDTNALTPTQLKRLEAITSLTAREKQVLVVTTNAPTKTWAGEQSRIQAEYAARYSNAVQSARSGRLPKWNPPTSQPEPARLRQ